MARIGGEEFAVAALTSSARDGVLLAEKIRQGIESQTFTWGQNRIQLTISMGLESRAPGSARITDLFNQLLMVADDSMIRAKKPDAIVFLRKKWCESYIRKYDGNSACVKYKLKT